MEQNLHICLVCFKKVHPPLEFSSCEHKWILCYQNSVLSEEKENEKIFRDHFLEKMTDVGCW